MLRHLVVCFLIVLTSTKGLGASGYYTIDDKPAINSSTLVTIDPLDLSQDLLHRVSEHFLEIQERYYSLVSFEFHNGNYGDVNEPYQRKKHFGTWAHDRRDSSCLNTRGKVLERDSSVQVTMSSTGCIVEKGRWDDPYTNKTFRLARDIQIDHFVPLKNAYQSGADKWTSVKRCLYANFLGNGFHLLSVNGTENSTKGDRGPDGYMPPNKKYSCQYLAQWLKVKLIWSLDLSLPEKAAVQNLIQSNQCAINDFVFSEGELLAQRQFMADNISLCE
jgi:hypothetical protein